MLSYIIIQNKMSTISTIIRICNKKNVPEEVQDLIFSYVAKLCSLVLAGLELSNMYVHQIHTLNKFIIRTIQYFSTSYQLQNFKLI